METNIDKQKIEDIFNRGIVAEVIPSKKELFDYLLAGKRLRVYIGADPTSSALHLSHAKNYMFLEDLRRLGHEVIVLFGDFTAQIGDPTAKNNARPQLSQEQVGENVKGWVEQIKPLMDFNDKVNPPKILYNNDWLSKLSFRDVVFLASNFTVQQMMERDMFEKRLENNTPIYLHEFLYPLMQGYDSVAMDVDAELCGTDQIFNALAGRTLLKRIKNKDKFVIALNLMENPETGELMSKSRGTGVFLSLPANDMYGAVMAQPDEMIRIFLVNNTRVPLPEIDGIMALGPRLSKARAAFEITKIFYGGQKAKEAEGQFNKTFSDGGIPDDVLEIKMVSGQSLARLLIDAGLVASKTEWYRLVGAGAVRDNDGKKITNKDFIPQTTTILKIGKRRFVKVVV